MNLSDAIARAASTLQGTTETPQLDASVLLCHVLDCPRSFLLSHPETALGPAQRQAFEALVTRRAQGEPVAYLTGVREFWSLELKVTPDVLIPRPETETLVEAALARMPADKPLRVAELGTGSGAIALALARERPRAHVVGTDISDAALAVARQNERLHGIPNVVFHESVWFAALEGQRFDLIVSNPPYVAEHDPHLEALRFEPRAALAAGPDGLDALRLIIREAPGYLEPGGWLLVEHGPAQDAAVRGLFAAAGFAAIETLPDLAGLPRVSLGRKN
ncbi:MAG TPA: peptide chain release factor N(5)-glutamine methyltransferase [Nevskiales bacterium]|nr:peptide chain release factor N(5)-glutamine methyltransferase [Nevskiales bacterium]